MDHGYCCESFNQPTNQPTNRGSGVEVGRLRLPSEGLRQGHGLARNDVWLMVWEDWAEILRANAGRATFNRGRHNAQCLPVWKQSGPTLSAGCAKSGPC